MPPVSVELKKQIKAANDIVDVISAYLPVLPAGKTFKAICPFHNDTRPSLQIDRTYQNYRCWACDARGDVFDFVMKFEKVDFPEALRSLAHRGGIALEAEAVDPMAQARSRMIDAMRWAQECYSHCLLEEPIAEAARTYLGGRRLSGATVRQFGLGYAPLAGDWLVGAASAAGVPSDLLVEVGLIAARDENRGFYDRFRDRVMFPIRDVRGQSVGFGGRVVPTSPLAARGPKYYNSADTPLFNKSDLLYGLDLARHAGTSAGFLAVVEGYTDVMMAHQCGVANVVATMGTALTARHVAQLRRFAPKVVLVYDADEGGYSGVDRALELFVSQDVELAIATLPAGLDPCDLLVQPDGPATFRTALTGAVDALEFKLNGLLTRESSTSIEGQRRVIDAILGVMAMAPPIPSQAGQIRQELIVSRLAHRLGVRQETVWSRLGELRTAHRKASSAMAPAAAVSAPAANPAPQPSGPAQRAERQLLELLLAEPGLVAQARSAITPEAVSHTGLRRMLSELYALDEAGQVPDLDALRVRLIERPDLVDSAIRLQYVGRQTQDRSDYLRRVIRWFADQAETAERKALKDRLASGSVGEDQTLELLRRLQTRAGDQPTETKGTI